MGILKKTMSVLVLVFFVASLTAASASAGYWKDKCDCGHKDKCDCGHKDKCDCHKHKCDSCSNFDFDAFFGGSFFGNSCVFGNGCFFGEDNNWSGIW